MQKIVIPTFPKFKPIEWTDRTEVQHFTNGLPPYSDFNFISMYCWNTRKKMMFSQLHGNLVLLFYDYITETPFLTFIGTHELACTALQLIEYSRQHYQTSRLKLIPETVARSLPDTCFNVVPDEGAFDYIIPISYLSMLDSSSLSHSSHNAAKLCQGNLKQYPHHSVQVRCKKQIHKPEYIEMFKRWAKIKSLNHGELNEYIAFVRLIQNPEIMYNMVSVYDAETLIGFATYEILSPEYAVCHFAKAEREYKGIYDRIYFEMGKALKADNITYINFEQDLGIPGLRQAKRKYKPEFYLKKYIVELKS